MEALVAALVLSAAAGLDEAPEALVREPPQDAAVDRGFAGQTGLQLPAGSWSFTQMDIAAGIVRLQMTDWLSVEAGSVPVAWVMGTNFINAFFSARAGTSFFDDRVHVSVGLQALVASGVMMLGPGGRCRGVCAPFAGALSVTVGYGTPSGHLSLTGLLPFNMGAATGASIGPGVFVNLVGYKRVSRMFGLLGEAWYLPMVVSPADHMVMAMAGTRLHVGRVAVDFGLGFAAWFGRGLMGGVPTPGLTITWNPEW